MGNIQIGQGNVIKNSVISSGVVVVGNEVTINGVKMPPCPVKGHNSTIVNNKVYLNGYELVNGKWKKTLKALWHKWF
jgi:NDP-sugar pyrophosphorylase family protein